MEHQVRHSPSFLPNLSLCNNIPTALSLLEKKVFWIISGLFPLPSTVSCSPDPSIPLEVIGCWIISHFGPLCWAVGTTAQACRDIFNLLICLLPKAGVEVYFGALWKQNRLLELEHRASRSEKQDTRMGDENLLGKATSPCLNLWGCLIVSMSP